VKDETQGRHLLDQGRDDAAAPGLGRVLQEPLATRQDRTQHPWGQLHRRLHLADLRQGRDRHLGDAGLGLPRPGGRTPAVRAARLPARHLLLLVSLQPPAGKVSLYPGVSPRSVEEGTGRAPGSRRGLDVAHRESRGAAALAARPREGRLPPGRLGHGPRAHCRRRHPHHQEARPGPDRRLLPHPGHVHGELRRGRPPAATHGRRVPLLLRLVLRPSLRLAGDLGRADRRPRVGRLV
jgi:hypothetical protein